MYKVYGWIVVIILVMSLIIVSVFGLFGSMAINLTQPRSTIAFIISDIVVVLAAVKALVDFMFTPYEPKKVKQDPCANCGYDDVDKFGICNNCGYRNGQE